MTLTTFPSIHWSSPSRTTSFDIRSTVTDGDWDHCRCGRKVRGDLDLATLSAFGPLVQLRPASQMAQGGRRRPIITRHNPIELHNPPGYHHVTVVESGRFAFLAGQCPLDVFGALVGAGDIQRQIDQVAANAAAVLAAIGARPDQVVRSGIYIVEVSPS
jgi:enamine deaminase RidA (YjgF/YER057c/UK114 family)